MSLTSIHTESAPAPAGHYSQAVVHAGVAYVSAILPKTADGALPDGVEAQTRQLLDNLDAVLRAAGGSLGTSLRVTLFLATLDDWAAVNAVFAEMFGEVKPARSIVAVKELKPGIHVSLDAIAAVS